MLSPTCEQPLSSRRSAQRRAPVPGVDHFRSNGERRAYRLRRDRRRFAVRSDEREAAWQWGPGCRVAELNANGGGSFRESQKDLAAVERAERQLRRQGEPADYLRIDSTLSRSSS